MNLFNLLLDHFGSQHWWPAKNEFEVIIGAILTQSVSWKNVEKAILNLESHDLLEPQALLNAPVELVQEAIRPTRYYRQKTERLRNFCQFLIEEHSGNLTSLFSLEMWELRTRLLALKGIGKETADSIILYAAEKPIFVVDAYTRRVFNRLGMFDEDISYDEMQSIFMTNLPGDPHLYNEYHALIVALGNMRCFNKRPRCDGCPLGEICCFPVSHM